MEIPRQKSRTTARFVAAVVLLGIPIAASSSPPPTPTPRAGTLAAYASATPLDRSVLADQTGPVVITSASLAELGRGASLTELTEPAAEPVTVLEDTEVNGKTREYWRKKVLAQNKVISKLEARRLAVEEEIDRIERGRLDSKGLDRLEKAEEKLRSVDTSIRHEKMELSRIVRMARKQGAQPGWFR
jgi:hypothetical protein